PIRYRSRNPSRKKTGGASPRKAERQQKSSHVFCPFNIFSLGSSPLSGKGRPRSETPEEDRGSALAWLGRFPFLIGAQGIWGEAPTKKACFDNACPQESLCQPSDTAKENRPFSKLGATVSAMESSPQNALPMPGRGNDISCGPSDVGRWVGKSSELAAERRAF